MKSSFSTINTCEELFEVLTYYFGGQLGWKVEDSTIGNNRYHFFFTSMIQGNTKSLRVLNFEV